MIKHVFAGSEFLSRGGAGRLAWGLVHRGQQGVPAHFAPYTSAWGDNGRVES